MKFLRRAGRSIVVMLPTGLVAIALIYGAWNQECNNGSCKAFNLVVMLTGFGLAVFSIFTLTSFYIMDTWYTIMPLGNTVLKNLTKVLPVTLFYAAFIGTMAYLCLAMFQQHFAGGQQKANKLLLLCAIFLPVYEITRLFERKKSYDNIPRPVQVIDLQIPKEEKKSTPFGVLMAMHIQTILTFSGWYYLMMLILENRMQLPSFAKAADWQFLYLAGVMAAASFILYKFYAWVEDYLGKQGTLSWDSKYFGKS